MYLVPKTVSRLLASTGGVRGDSVNAGLLYDKFVNIWPDGFEFQGEEWKRSKQRFLEEVVECLRRHRASDALLKAMHQRRRAIARRLGGKVIEATTAERLVIGLGSHHPLETGLLFHRTLGVPYIPGSSLKGLIRAWADPGNAETPGWAALGDRQRVLELFGDTDEHGCGRLILLDGLPVAKPALEVDIINPHYGPYYQDPAGTPPADYHSPVPVPFLTVASGQKFEFVLLPAGWEGNPEDLSEGLVLLTDALQTLGIGGKTAVGYGTFRDVHECPLGDTSKHGRERVDRKDKAEDRQAASGEAQDDAAGATHGGPDPAIPLDSDLAGILQELRAMPPDEKWKQQTMGYFQAFNTESDEARRKQWAEVLRLAWIRCDGCWNGSLSKKQREKVAAVKKVLGLD